MDTLTNSMPDPTNLSLMVAFAIQTTLILFFVVSPIMGYLLARTLTKRTNLVLAWCTGVLIILVGTFGISLLLRRAIPPERLSDAALTLLCGAASVAAGVLLARYIQYYLAEPGKPQWLTDYENLPAHELLPFERRKRLEQKRRRRHQR